MKLPQAIFPVDILDCIIDYLETEDLRAFALTSSLHNRIASRRIWKGMTIGAKEFTHGDIVCSRYDALTRLHFRANSLHTLKFGLPLWVWTNELLNQTRAVWKATTNLRHLHLMSPLDPEF